jgi:hypothetical protein
VRRIDEQRTRSYAELYELLAPGELLADPPESWATDWGRASADSFNIEALV